MGEVRRFILEESKNAHLLEGSQASPVRPSDRSSVKVKTLGWLEIVARDRGRGIFFF
jgi:hypothetical protein